jgi:hypothetical protein
MKFRAVVLLAVFFVCTLAQGDSTGVRNFESLARALGYTPYYSKQNFHRPKISILDNGFAGYSSAVGKSISSRTEYFGGTHEDPMDQEAANNEVHGLYMAKLVYAFMTENGKKPELEPELYLHDAFNYYNFENSVKKAIELKSDIILYAQVWDQYDNFDGTGIR